MKSSSIKTDVVILGAGIGGYETFRTLAKLFRRYGIKKEITIIDQNNYFTFTPLLHEVASGAVEPTHAALPLREIVYKTPHKFLKATITAVDPKKKIVDTSAGKINYEYCVLALGSTTNFYGVPGAAEFSYQVRTLRNAMHLRHSLIEALEECESGVALTVVGGGYTGVEVAGQMSYLIHHDLKKLYPEKIITIRLVQNGGALVPQLPPRAQELILKRLKKMGIEILFNAAVKEVKKNSVLVGSSVNKADAPQEIPSDFTIWCAGFGNVANCFLTDTFCTVDHRVPTTSYLTHPQAPSLYTLGDIALATNQGETKPLPQLGEVAYHEGHYVARHIVAAIKNKIIRPFHFSSKGTLMPIGDRYGIGVFGNVVIGGWFMWWLRRTVYLFFMPGILRKLRIVMDWTLRLFGFSYTIAIERNLEHGPKNLQYNPKFNS